MSFQGFSSRCSLAWWLLVAWLMIGVGSAASAPSSADNEKLLLALGGTPNQIEITPEEKQLVDLANLERKKRGRPQLTVAPILVKVARAHSQEMCEKRYFSHYSPTPHLRTPLLRYQHAIGEQLFSALSLLSIGENIYYCSKLDLPMAHRSIMGSKKHRDRLLSKEYRYIGVGIYKDDQGQFWVTQMFLTVKVK